MAQPNNHQNLGFCATRTPGERGSTQPTDLLLASSLEKPAPIPILIINGISRWAGDG
ncbi:MAG: hypothetical protein ACRCT1_05160 [Microcoleaceae cyanobacterium]